MVFEKKGQCLVVSDRVQIDCLKAKKWVEVAEQLENQSDDAKEVKPNARKTSVRTE